VYYTRYPHNKGRNSVDWWAACKVRPKLFMVETLKNDEDFSNEKVVNDYFQDDGSMGMTNIVLDDEEIQLFDDNAPMEEVNMDDVHYPIHNVHNDQFFNDNDELLDEDIELNDLDEELDDSNNDLDNSDDEWL